MKRNWVWLTLVIGVSVVLSQPSDPKEYARWKRNLAPSANTKSPMTLGPIENDYVAVQIQNTFGFFGDTSAGCFNIGTSSRYTPRPSATLLYNYPDDPWSSHAVFRVDDHYYSYSSRPSDPPGPPTILASTASGHSFTIRDTVINILYPLTGELIPDSTQYIHAGWMAGGVLIMQNLAPIYVYSNSYTTLDTSGLGLSPSEFYDSLFSPTFWGSHLVTRCDTSGTILIQYIVENPDAVAHDVGILLEMDTMIGINDAAPLATSFGYAATEQQFLASEGTMPDVWYAGENDPPWGPDDLVAQGILSGMLEATTPDRFLVGSWPSFNDVTWDYTPSYSSYFDSAVLIYWFPRTIPPGGSFVFNTYYGLKLPERTRPITTISSPPSLIVSACPAQEITVQCRDNLGIDTSGFAISINGHVLPYSSAYMEPSWSGDSMSNVSITVTPPAGLYASCETVKVVAISRDFFGNFSNPDTLYFISDLEGPYVADFSISDGDTLGITSPISADIADDCSGIDTSTILVAFSGYYTGSHSFPIGDGVSYAYIDSAHGTLTFDPEAAGIAYHYDDSIVFGIARCSDRVSEEYCGPNPVQDNLVFFFTPDNDTIPPVVRDYSPHYTPPNQPITVQVVFHDEAGVDTCSPTYIYDGTGPYPAYMNPYILWDDDGEVSVDHAGRIDLVAVDETTFVGATTIPPYPGGSRITFKVFAYDNDFSRGRIEDALPVVDNLETIQVTDVPTATLVSPPESSLTSCEDQVIVIALQCSTGILEDSLRLYVNGVSYDITSDQLIFDPTTNYLEFHPSGTAVFTDGAVQIQLTGLYDEFGTPGENYSWVFFVDVTPPVLSNEIPPQGSEEDDISFDVSFTLEDIGPIPEATAGLDTSSVRVWITNSDGTFEVTDYLTHEGNVFTFNTDSAGLSFLDNETVTIRVQAGDAISITDWCDHGPNVLDTTWSFVMSETPCERTVNPITPANLDGFNDYTLFRFPNMRSTKLEKTIYIYDRYNHLVREIKKPDADGWKWDGRDDQGDFVPQGVYVYVIVVGGEAVCNGTVSVAR